MIPEVVPFVAGALVGVVVYAALGWARRRLELARSRRIFRARWAVVGEAGPERFAIPQAVTPRPDPGADPPPRASKPARDRVGSAPASGRRRLRRAKYG